MSTIEVPELVRNGELVTIVSASGGKDSTAVILALREAQVPCRYVFADTQWEAQETYDYLGLLEHKLGITIARVGVPGGMRARSMYRAGFPSRMQRWCTRELKLEPLREFYNAVEKETGLDSVCAVGVRGQESSKRAQMAVWDDDETWGGWMWRPLLNWKIEDVLAIHHRHDVPVNPLYLRGHSRVGCYPCIYARKEEIRLIAEHDPERIDEVAAFELEIEAERAKRNAEQPGRYAHPAATFFMARQGIAPQHIHEIVAWAKGTNRTGHRQLSLLPTVPSEGCFRWGLCEPPPIEEDSE